MIPLLWRLAGKKQIKWKALIDEARRELIAKSRSEEKRENNMTRNIGLIAEGPTYKILGVRVNAVQIPEVISHMQDWIARRDACRYIAVTDMHSLMQAQRVSSFKAVLEGAALAVPDGFPLVWLARRKGFPLRRRVYGPELMERFCAATAAKGYRHFFYGGAPGVAEALGEHFSARFPGCGLPAHTVHRSVHFPRKKTQRKLPPSTHRKPISFGLASARQSRNVGCSNIVVG